MAVRHRPKSQCSDIFAPPLIVALVLPSIQTNAVPGRPLPVGCRALWGALEMQRSNLHCVLSFERWSGPPGGKGRLCGCFTLGCSRFSPEKLRMPLAWLSTLSSEYAGRQ